MICFGCGCFGHSKDKCTSVIVNPVVRSETCDPKASSNLGASNDNSEMTHEMDTVNDSPFIIKEDMGPWMLMNYRNKKKVSKVGGSGQTPAKGSRFSVLQDENVNATDGA